MQCHCVSPGVVLAADEPVADDREVDHEQDGGHRQGKGQHQLPGGGRDKGGELGAVIHHAVMVILRLVLIPDIQGGLDLLDGPGWVLSATGGLVR